MFRNWQDKHASNSEPQQATGDSQITLDLPWPPTANRYWRNVNGRMVLSREGRRYREAVDGLVWRHVCQAGDSVSFGTSRLELEIDAHPPDNRRRDLDNLLKPILDALQYAEVFEDDSQIVKILIRKRCVVSAGVVRISLRKVMAREFV